MLKFDENQLLDWTQGIRENPDMLNAFWPSQIRSKLWLADWVKSYLPSATKIVIFGAWYGVLADILNLRLQPWHGQPKICLLYTSPSPRDRQKSRMPSSA